MNKEHARAKVRCKGAILNSSHTIPVLKEYFTIEWHWIDMFLYASFNYFGYGFFDFNHRAPILRSLVPERGATLHSPEYQLRGVDEISLHFTGKILRLKITFEIETTSTWPATKSYIFSTSTLVLLENAIHM
ncbi:unnamed protein product [Leptosia nina]|uniref:Uncharacterized protein n=1 Tax=Leptosia nina TaxID=320188 RepID=A0AAV1JBP1_9NEOP